MSDLENFDIRTHIINSIVETFDTMISMKIESSDSESTDTSGTNRMVATVNFAGNVAGIFNIQVTSEVARLMHANMLDIEPEKVESDDEIRDLLAEISNIVGGNLKSALNDAGHPCVLSTPSITYGGDFSIRSLNMEKFERFVFKHQQNIILVEVGLKTQQASGGGDGIGASDALGQLKEIDVEKISALDIKKQVSEAAIDVFDTMFSVKLEITDSVTPESIEGVRHAGSVSFAGDVTGMVSIHVGDDFSRELAAEMLGMETEEIKGDEEITDMLGEVGNIVGGNLKSSFTDAGLTCALSTPSFTTGTDFKIETLNLTKHERIAFSCGKHIVFAELGVKISELVQTESEAKEPQESKISTPPVRIEEKDSPEKQDSETLEDIDLNLLLDIPLEIKVELGRVKIPIHELLNLAPGSAVKLLKLEGEPLDILANNTLIARGEVVVQNEKYGIRVTEITSRMDRIRSFGI